MLSCGNVNKLTNELRDGEIIEGKGVGSFVIGKTKADEVIKKLGTKYEELKHKDYSTELYYKEFGLSFYYYQSDPEKEIFAIEFKEPFKGKTTKGIGLNNMTMNEVVKVYGEPEWTSCESCDTWTAEYEGIEFEVARDKSLPHFPLNEEVHLKKVITAIAVSEDE